MGFKASGAKPLELFGVMDVECGDILPPGYNEALFAYGDLLFDMRTSWGFWATPSFLQAWVSDPTPGIQRTHILPPSRRARPV